MRQRKWHQHLATGPSLSSQEQQGLQLISKLASHPLTLHKLRTVLGSDKQAMLFHPAFSKQVSMLQMHPSLRTSNQLGNQIQIFSSKRLAKRQAPYHLQPLKLETQVRRAAASQVTYGIS